MKIRQQYLRPLFIAVAGAATAMNALAASKSATFDWTTVVNNADLMPPLAVRNFNSYNQPSVNMNGLVVIRARSRGGAPLGKPTHGIYARDMSLESPITRILDQTTKVPQPNNLGSTFVETPSFPRIDIDSNTIATRGNHQPVWQYLLGNGTETRAGTTGIYATPFSDLITAAAKLGTVPDFTFCAVPEFPGTTFEVFPGAPSVTDDSTLVFKGNYTDPGGVARTGIYYRELLEDSINGKPGGGSQPAVLIANSTTTLIPGSTTVFGSTAPPSAARGKLVFAGFDNENAPTMGGIYLAPLQFQPQLTPLVTIGQQVPDGYADATFNKIGEAAAFDGRFVAFWGAWGDESRRVRLYCSEEGSRERIDYCNKALLCEGSDELLGDENSICDDKSDPNFAGSCYQDKQVPLHQGFFVHDISTGRTWTVAKTGEQFSELLFWNYSGKTPCTGGHSGEDGGDDGEAARWRASAFVTVSGRGATYQSAFKARGGELDEGVYQDPVDGIYLTIRPSTGPGTGESQIVTVLETGTDGQLVDPEAPVGSTITELGLEREGLRGDWLAISAKMGGGIEQGEEADDMAGVYITCASHSPQC